MAAVVPPSAIPTSSLTPPLLVPGDVEESCPALLEPDNDAFDTDALALSLSDIIRLDDDTPPTTPRSKTVQMRQGSDGAASMTSAVSIPEATCASPLLDARGDMSSPSHSRRSTTVPPFAEVAPPSPTNHMMHSVTIGEPPARAFRSRAQAMPPSAPPVFAPVLSQIPAEQLQQAWQWAASSSPLSRASSAPPSMAPVALPSHPSSPTASPRSVMSPSPTSMMMGHIPVVSSPTYAPNVTRTVSKGEVTATQQQQQTTPSSSRQNSIGSQASDVSNRTNAYSLFISKALEQSDTPSNGKWPRAHTSQARSRKGVLLARLRAAADRWELMTEEERKPYHEEAERNRNCENTAPLVAPLSPQRHPKRRGKRAPRAATNPPQQVF